MIKPNYLVILPPTQHHSFFRNLPPLLIHVLQPRIKILYIIILGSYLKITPNSTQTEKEAKPPTPKAQRGKWSKRPFRKTDKYSNMNLPGILSRHYNVTIVSNWYPICHNDKGCSCEWTCLLPVLATWNFHAKVAKGREEGIEPSQHGLDSSNLDSGFH